MKITVFKLFCILLHLSTLKCIIQEEKEYKQEVIGEQAVGRSASTVSLGRTEAKCKIAKCLITAFLSPKIQSMINNRENTTNDNHNNKVVVWSNIFHTLKRLIHSEESNISHKNRYKNQRCTDNSIRPPP